MFERNVKTVIWAKKQVNMLQIPLERYAHSEISGTAIPLYRYNVSDITGTLP